MLVTRGEDASTRAHIMPSRPREKRAAVDVYISADVETDGPIPGPFSMLSFAFVEVGRSDGTSLIRPQTARSFYRELKPISEQFEPEALAINGLDRELLGREGTEPRDAMDDARRWVREISGEASPILVAFPLSFDWTWLYWYFIRFGSDSPFNHSRCFDIKTAYAVKGHRTVATSGRDQLVPELRPQLAHTHHALDDAREQAEIFARLFAWQAPHVG
jgi:DNA polymerase III epsilon subunit-like protein